MGNDSTLKGKIKSKITRWGIFGAVLSIVFLLGLAPMWMQKRAVVEDLATTQQQLHKSDIKGLLTTAIVESKRGEYETARKNTSNFFTQLRAEVDKGEESGFTKEERDKLTTIFANRDATITLLAQRDQASTERLTDIYVIYQQAVKQVLIASPSVSPTVTASPIASPVSSPTLPQPKQTTQ